MTTVMALAKWEFQNAVRTRWVLGGGAAFSVSAVGVAMLGMQSAGDLGLTGAGPAATSLLGLTMLLPPLFGLLLGAGAVAGSLERGTLQMLLVQPGVRGRYVAGTFLGLATAMWAILAAGLGLVGLLLGATATVGDARPLLGVAVAAIGVSTASVALGMMISALCRSRSQATAWCVVAWFFFGIGADLLLISLVPALDIGPAGILSTIVVNPVETARTLALLVIDPQLSALGPFGAFMVWELGAAWAVTALSCALVLWCAVSLTLSHLVIRRAEL